MNWKFLQSGEPVLAQQLADALASQSPFPLPLAHILVQRGIKTLDEAKEFFAPQRSLLHDPFLMKGMEKAVNRLVKAINHQEIVVIYGDYDVDGTTSVALVASVLKELGAKYLTYIPDRYVEGYGISMQGVRWAKEQGATLMVALDCGIRAIEPTKLAQSLGMDLLICDHHIPGPELPDALAILNPTQSDCQYPYKYLSGCGIGLKFMMALVSRMSKSGFLKNIPEFDPLDKYGDLVALSIACDLVPMTGENRLLAHWGLKKLNDHALPGIQALKDQAPKKGNWIISDLVFGIGPKINAIGRLHHAKDAVELLMGQYPGVLTIANELEQVNQSRKELDQRITQQALSMISQDRSLPNPKSTVLYHQSWHRGVLGIVASKLIEQHFRPTILFADADGLLVGSARSVPGFDLFDALGNCESYIEQWGGHKHAAGLKIRPEHFQAFKNQFESVVAQSITPDQLSPDLYIDQDILFSDIHDKFVRLLDRMEPFGPRNRRPVFAAKGVNILQQKILKEKHVKFLLEQSGTSFEAIGFNMADKLAKIPQQQFDIAFQPFFDTWNQQTRIKLRLKDFKY
ncbi:single-stranded-DNA-specific exonuclease RecJ [Pontibacter sp. G13]|uniref:single-stranded-DNA-specific exonuclease RecJ n=1 Tax=Pontibacter sp. G13 TaxID=3074898 RepID=UPI00288B13B2|nr:single-stranded-DNA-specific exonuclease RecJ [Pontibacter sp. G13]WNJ21223.1 single-stranded-DNA-specific exonuclease RecJ [Pontibacter sp. G13]